MEKVLGLLSSRAAGEATNDQVEAAIDELLLGRRQTTTIPASGATTTTSDGTAASQSQSRNHPQLKAPPHGNSASRLENLRASNGLAVGASSIEEDLGNYDDDNDEEDDDDEADDKGDSKPAASVLRPTAAATISAGVPGSSNPSTTGRNHHRKRPRRASSGKAGTSSKALSPAEQSVNWKLTYESIPLGRQGAKMMVAFGDGPHPIPSVVAKTLQATRLMLLAAIRDARHVRRRHQRQYQQALLHARGRSKMVAAAAEVHSSNHRPPPPVVDAHLQFRAMHSHDDLGKSPKCGFGTEELRVLYPEEINAYERWSELHHYTNVNNNEEDNINLDDETDKPESTNEDVNTENSNGDDLNGNPKEVAGGHLMERMVQFDIRTDRMDKDNYLQFSNVRFQGSFLPRRVVGEDRHRAPVRGRAADGSTTNMAIVMVRFLHWVGFDVDGVVPSHGAEMRLPAPNADTTQVLAFLAHDFFGRIVEKAIFWRNVQDDETKVLLELPENEQLQDSDIARALEDPEVRLTSLYAARNDGASAPSKPQLYFGPGFEERLEMELEEFAEPPTEDEVRARQEEDILFAHLSQDHGNVMLEGGKAGTDRNHTADCVSSPGTERRRHVMLEARRSWKTRPLPNDDLQGDSDVASTFDGEDEDQPRTRRTRAK